LLETKLSDIQSNLVNRLWNEQRINGKSTMSEEQSEGMLVMWNDNRFQVSLVEYGAIDNSVWYLFGGRFCL